MLTQWINMSKEAELTYRAMGFIVLMSLLATFSEIFGFGIFLPIFQYIKMGGLHWELLKKRINIVPSHIDHNMHIRFSENDFYKSLENKGETYDNTFLETVFGKE